MQVQKYIKWYNDYALQYKSFFQLAPFYCDSACEYSQRHADLCDDNLTLKTGHQKGPSHNLVLQYKLPVKMSNVYELWTIEDITFRA